MDKQITGHRALRQGRVSIPGQVYLVTTTTLHRAPLFLDWRLAREACQHFERSIILNGSKMLAWVLMPDHAHWLIQLGGQLTLSNTVMRIKSASARHACRTGETISSLWARGFHDRAIRREADILPAARYIVANPVRAGIADRIGDYPFWNSVWL